MIRLLLHLLVLFGCAAMAQSAFAQSETSTFTYDSLGRLIDVESDRPTGTVDYDFFYDTGHNRTSVVITEQSNSASPAVPGPEPQSGDAPAPAGAPQQ